jgi:dihydrolipoamide dehydrogenase
MSELRVDAVVIGAGPGGYPCGIRLGQLKVKAVVVEKEYWGGVCLNVGCIPSKAVIHAAKMFDKMGHADELGIAIAGKPTIDMKKMQAWKSGVVGKLTSGVKTLLKGNKTDVLEGKARLVRGEGGLHKVIVEGGKEPTSVLAKSVVIATGSRPIEIPGFQIDQKRVIDSTGALALDHVPPRLVVIGGGYIGLELGMVYAKFGSKVTVVEALPSILASMDKDCVGVVARKLKKMGVEVLTEAKAKSWEEKGDRAVLTVEGKDGKAITIDCDKILSSVGRRPNTEGLGLEEVGVKLDKRGYVVADDQCRTSVPNIYAIGDVIGGMMLAHKATKEGETVAEIIAGHKAAVDVRTIPAVVFTDPEIASAGLTEEEAKEKGHAVKVGKFPFAALGRALSVNDPEGFAKVICDAKSEEILGVHIVGNGAGDLISEAALAIEMGAVIQDLNLTVHPHPTLSEAVREAAAAAVGEAVHIINR